ncbi:MAG: deoxyribonuclease/rho motif-related [Frankiales bacterium]|nr:deoxyribonuclease/rho motif-related [Frankiales bacterium]
MTGVDVVLELELGQVAAGGACVSRAPDGRVVFVRHGLPGERVRAVVTGETAKYLRADAVEVLQAAPERVEPPCPYARPGRCGGCDFQHVALPHQRVLKARLVAEQLQRLAGVAWDGEVEVVPGDDDGLGWRTRIAYAADAEGRLGLHRHRSHDLQLLDRCLIAAPGLPPVLDLPWPGATVVEGATTATGDQQVVHVEGRPSPLPEVDAGVVVGGRRLRSPHGLSHVVRGRRFEVSAGGFWQGHRGAADLLADVVLDALAPRPGEAAVDLYAGAGLFAALLGDAVGPDGRVLAVESDPRAAADAARNTADLSHVKVRTEAVDAAVVRRLGRPDLVVLDPPRAGAGLEVARALSGLRPRALAWVSCDAASFARDLRVMLDVGWELESLRAFDAFPMTEHVETVALLSAPVF